MRFLIATSALNARESTAALIMKVRDSMNESFKLGLTKGPHCVSVHQTTNAEIISVAVAVSRGPWRSEAHSTGRMTTQTTALSRVVPWNRGLKAIAPAARAAR